MNGACAPRGGDGTVTRLSPAQVQQLGPVSGTFLRIGDTSRLVVPSGLERNVLIVWDYLAGEQVARFEVRVGADVGMRAISPDGDHLLLAAHHGSEPEILQWSIRDRKIMRRYLGHKRHRIQRVQFLRDGRRFVSVADDGYGIVWDTQSTADDPSLGVFAGHCSSGLSVAIAALAVSPDGKMALSGDIDGNAYLWSTEEYDDQGDLKLVRRFPRILSDHRPSGKVIPSMNPVTNKVTWERDDHQYGAAISAVAFFPDGKRVVIADEERCVRLYDVQTGREVARHEQSHDKLRAWDVTVSHDQRFILLASSPFPKLWEWSSGWIAELEGHVLTQGPLAGQPGGVSRVGFSVDGAYAMTLSGHDRTMRLWKVPR